MSSTTKPGAKERPLHSISFDVEEYYQVANLRGHFGRDDWDGVESRLSIGMGHILDCLERHDAHATFFWLGWVAERHPDLVRRCLDEGHEIASHGYEHEFLWDLGPERLDDDLAKTEKALMDAGAPCPRGFRASTFTLTDRTWWALGILERRGYLYDSSIHPVRHPVYGMPGFEPGISRIPSGSTAVESVDPSQSEGGILEYPVSTFPMLGRNWPFGGGGYFRLLPGAALRSAVASLEGRGRPVAIYLHPWEFDPDQPRVGAKWHQRFRHYLNLDRTLPRLEKLLANFRFGSMAEVLRERGLLAP